LAGVEVVGEAMDGAQAIQRAAILDPDLVLMDFSMSHMDGLAATRHIRRIRPATRIIIFTAHDSDELRRSALVAGADGYVSKFALCDELPQLMNIIRGELSFVGPRPERPEWVGKLKEQIPYYETRLLVKPGVTGWAQINHPADTDLEDVKQKLQYDIYYLKNRSLVLDLAIVVKTFKAFFVNPNKK
jgi:CheY-like chemotaxis protein